MPPPPLKICYPPPPAINKEHSPIVRGTATHNIWLLAVRYRLISRFIFPLKNPLKHALIWGVTACLQEFVGQEDDFFMGTISLKDLVSIPLLKLNILLHIYDRKLCARQNAWTFWHEQVPCPPLNSPQWTRWCDRRMFTLIHLPTFSGCLWLQEKRLLCAQWENRVIHLVMIHYYWIFSLDIEPAG